MLFYDDIENKTQISPWVESIDVYGNKNILGKNGFDALIILKDITPVRRK